MRYSMIFLLPLALLAGCASGAGVAPGASVAVPTPTALVAPATGASPGLEAVIASSEIVVGQNRLAVGLLQNKQPILNAKVHERFYYLDAPDAAAQQQVRGEADAIYYSENLPLGVYVTHPVFDKPGSWGVEIATLAPSANLALMSRVRFTVSTIAVSPAIGTLPPASHNRTLATEPDITKITSDDHPDPDLYRLTVADAIKSGKPTLVLFATPRYCVSRMCGPTLEMLKGLKQKYADQANFIHIEIYQDFTTFAKVPEFAEWHLPSEPWLFMLDRLGPVVAKYEGGLTRQEIEPALVELLRR